MILFYLLITVMPLMHHPVWEMFVGELTLIKYLGVGCLLYAFGYAVVRESPLRLFETWQARCFALLAVLGMASWVIMGPPTRWETSPFMSYFSFLSLFYITVAVVDSPSRLRKVLLAAIGSVALASLYVLREWQKYQGIYPNFRPGWVTGDPNYFTVSALLCLPVAFYMLQGERPKWEKVLCLGGLVMTLFAVTLGASRGGFLGLLAASLLVMWRTRRRVRNLTIVGALLLSFSLVLPTSPVERLLMPSRGDHEGVEVRKAVWRAGLRMVCENPLTGIGSGNFKPMVGSYGDQDQDPERVVAHNTYIEIAAELGLPGLLAFLGILFGSFYTLEQVRRKTSNSGQSLLHQVAQGIQAGLVSYMVASFFVSAQYQKLFWLMIFLTICLPALERETSTGKVGGQRTPRQIAGVLGDQREGPWLP